MVENCLLKSERHTDGKTSRMLPLRVTIVFVLLVGLAGCGSKTNTGTGTSGTVMPDVVGLRLDVALSDIKRAGIEDEVEILGGGTFGVVVKSKWQVCAQLPAAGDAVTVAPRLTVDRSCGDGTPNSTSQSATPPDTQPTAQTATQPTAPSTAPLTTQAIAAEETLTVKNSADLASILSEADYCSDTIAEFAATYRGGTIEFDGNIAAMNNHGDYKTRYDILVVAGDYSTTSQFGPAFQFEDVNIFDLNLAGSNVPDRIGTGDNLHIRATVEGYSSVQCLFFLKPVSTEVR